VKVTLNILLDGLLYRSVRMDSTLWYLIAFCGIFTASLMLWALKFMFPNFRNYFVRHLKYPLLVSRGHYWDSITRLEAFFLLLFISLNIVIIFSPFAPLEWRMIERRAAIASGINIIPVCLGGRMGPVVEAFNIHRSTSRLLHHWIGRMAIIDGLIHAIVVLSLRPRPGTLVTSGWAVRLPTKYGCGC
jgi:type IV secretory pathway TrbD component